MSEASKHGIRPEVRYFIPCWKEPTITSGRPSAHEIILAVRPKSGNSYPLWHPSTFLLVLITNLHGVCRFHVELRLDEVEDDILVQASDEFTVDVGNDPLRVQPLSIMMKAARLPKPGVYRLSFVSVGEALATATIHAR